ncbi:hypothetical protein D3C71_645020 [compost metagenome]
MSNLNNKLEKTLCECMFIIQPLAVAKCPNKFENKRMVNSRGNWSLIHHLQQHFQLQSMNEIQVLQIQHTKNKRKMVNMNHLFHRLLNFPIAVRPCNYQKNNKELPLKKA